jgi:hypothetical protein
MKKEKIRSADHSSRLFNPLARAPNPTHQLRAANRIHPRTRETQTQSGRKCLTAALMTPN